jgi:hypothetical protein
VAKTKRNVGQEILDGIRQIKRGERGRVTSVGSVSSVRAKTGHSQRPETSARVKACDRKL